MEENYSSRIAFSVDLEPNKDDSLTGVKEAMEWYKEAVPRGTLYVTYRIATELPDVVASLAETHEIGVHVHPREFGHENDELAELPPERQRDLISRTRTTLSEAGGISEDRITTFRAGRHSASEETFDVLRTLGFTVDASINVRYDEYLPAGLRTQSDPFLLSNGLVELPTTYITPSLLSRVGLRVFPQRTVTATAATLRSDSLLCSGLRAVRAILSANVPVVSMYMHPYDASSYHGLQNGGQTFRNRVETVLSEENRFLSASEVASAYDVSD